MQWVRMKAHTIASLSKRASTSSRDDMVCRSRGVADSKQAKENRVTGSLIEQLRRLKESACHHNADRAWHGVPSGLEINGRASFLQLLKCVLPVVSKGEERSRQDILSITVPLIARRAMTKLLQFWGPLRHSAEHPIGRQADGFGGRLMMEGSSPSWIAKWIRRESLKVVA